MAEYTFELKTEGGKLIAGASVPEKNFSTGNTGYFVNGNTALPMVAHLSGQPLTLIVKDAGKPVVQATLMPRRFSTGSYGYHATWKSSDMRYQCQFQLVLGKSKTVPFTLADDMRKSGLATLKNGYSYQCQMVDLVGEDTVAKADFTVDAKGSIDSVDMAALKAGGTVLSADVAAANAAIDALKL
jgi:hypothetical protein